MSASKSRVIRCARCDTIGQHKGRGLCTNCYWWHWKYGGLDRYPTRPVKGEYWRAKVNPEAVDPVIVERILGGDWRMKANPSEKAEVCRRWVRSGRSLRQLELLTGWASHRYYQLREAS